jgi:hypothetical protein
MTVTRPSPCRRHRFAIEERARHGSITVDRLQAPDFTCPSGQNRVLASVSYTNIVLTDTTNNKSISAPDVSRTFVAV